MEEIKSMVASLDIKKQQEKLKKLSKDVHEVMKKNGLVTTAACRTVCSAKVIIGPDGKPQTVIECQLVCDI